MATASTNTIKYSVFMKQNPINPDRPAQAYATAQVNKLLTLNDFASHIASHSSVFSRGTVKGVLTDMCSCLREQLLSGNKVQLDTLGTFSITLQSKGADSKEDFSAAEITKINVCFSPGSDLADLRSDAVFEKVASRFAQRVTLKAETKDDKNVSLDKEKANAEGGE